MAGTSQHIARQRRRFPLLIRIALIIAAAVLLADNARLRHRLEHSPRSIGEPSRSSAGSLTGTSDGEPARVVGYTGSGNESIVGGRLSTSGGTESRAASHVTASSKGDEGGRSSSKGPDAEDASSIPHILHQSWKDEHVPERFHAWQATWQVLHPGWEFRLWTDADNRKLLEDHYPWFLKTYDALPKPIMRADAIRPFYMYHHGGVYADLDVEALKNMEPLLTGHLPVLAFMSDTWWLRHNIPNAWMASPPRHPFWQHCWAHTMLEFRPGVPEEEYYDGGIERVTGPVALMECLEAYVASTGRNVTVLPPGKIFAYDWHKVTYCREDWCIRRVQECGANEKTFDPDKCKAHYPDAYAITYWAHTWGGGATADAAAGTSGEQQKVSPGEAGDAGVGEAKVAGAAVNAAKGTAEGNDAVEEGAATKSQQLSANGAGAKAHQAAAAEGVDGEDSEIAAAGGKDVDTTAEIVASATLEQGAVNDIISAADAANAVLAGSLNT